MSARWPRQRGPRAVPITITTVGVIALGAVLHGHAVIAHHAQATSASTPVVIATPSVSVDPYGRTHPTPTATSTNLQIPHPTATLPAYAAPMAAAAEAGVRAWQQPIPGLRAAALDATATKEFATAVAGADPAQIPDAPIIDTQLVTEADGQARMQVVLADATVLLVDVVHTSSGWLMSGITPGG